MATSELASTPHWAGGMLREFVVGFLLVGPLAFVLASPALFITGEVAPASVPYLWLGLVMFIVSTIGYSNTHQTLDLETILALIEPMNSAERLMFVVSIMLITTGGVSFHVGLIGYVAAGVSTTTGVPLAGVILAAIYPNLDAYLGRRFGVSFAVSGMWVVEKFLQALALLQGLSTAVPHEAGVSVRGAMR